MPPLRFAVAGAGLIGRRHVELIQASSACALSAIADPAPAAAALAAQCGVPHFASLADCIATARPDAVILATPNALHVEQALMCIEAGLPALVEKPVAHTVADAERLLRAIDSAKAARILVGHHRAHSPIMARAVEAVRSGRLGRITAVMGSALFCKPDDYFDVAWRRESGGGPILINLIHEIHNLRMLCGEITAVQAFASNAARGFAVEDTAAINLRFASGALGVFMLSDSAASPRSWEQTAQENAAYASYADEDCYVIAGTLGSLSIPTMRLKSFASAAERSWFKPFDAAVLALTRSDPLERQLAHFCDVVRGAVAPLVSVRDGLANLRLTEAIAEAARSGGTVHLEA